MSPSRRACLPTLIERADLLVYCVPLAATRSGSRRLIDELRSLYGDKPVILFEPASGTAWVDGDLPVTNQLEDDGRFVGLDEVLEEALGYRPV